MKRILVVDDSIFVRKLVKDILSSSGKFSVETAVNGQDALNRLEEFNPHAITLDVEMPGLSGLSVLAKIMETKPTPVVMLSSLTVKGADASIAALNLGAVDIIAKPATNGFPLIKDIADEILNKVTVAAEIDPSMLTRLAPGPGISDRKPLNTSGSALKEMPVVLIASSTGGPRALRYIIPKLPADTPAFFLVIQHLPIGFTASMAKDLDRLSALPVREAEDGDQPAMGMVLIAPAGKHCSFSRGGIIRLTDDPPLWGVKPAADVSFASAGTVFGTRTIGVVLTGMGHDGAHGLAVIRSHGGRTLAEAESSCVVYGMPKEAVESGSAERSVDLKYMPEAIDSAIRSIHQNRPL